MLAWFEMSKFNQILNVDFHFGKVSSMHMESPILCFLKKKHPLKDFAALFSSSLSFSGIIYRRDKFWNIRGIITATFHQNLKLTLASNRLITCRLSDQQLLLRLGVQNVMTSHL
jgi:hypothetical protein